MGKKVGFHFKGEQLLAHVRPGGTTGDTWDESLVLFEQLFSKLHKMSPVIFQRMK